MRLPISFLLCFTCGILFCQNITRESISRSYALGETVLQAIEQKDIITLNRLLNLTKSAQILVAASKSEKFKSGDYPLFKDIYYHPGVDAYIFTIHSAKWIKTDSDWGLNDYLYALELKIEYDPKTKIPTITDHHLLEEESDLKNWWRSFMNSYNDPVFLRDQWNREFDLVPPPPPPPQTTAWFE